MPNITLNTPGLDVPQELQVEQARVIEAVSPTIDAERVEGGVQITVEDYREEPQTVVVYDGEQGPQGETGPAGQDGAPGPGVAAGGTTGQVLKKASNSDYDTEWANESGAVTDVQVNGTSIVSGGVANVPYASRNGSVSGVVKIDQTYGVSIGQNASAGILCTKPATSLVIKAGDNSFLPIVSGSQHQSAFYGLAKAAGDTTQSRSDNPVGTYTDEAKAAIKTMLGVTEPPTTLAGLTDTNISNPQAAQVLQYYNGKWINHTISVEAPAEVLSLEEFTDDAGEYLEGATMLHTAWDEPPLDAGTLYSHLTSYQYSRAMSVFVHCGFEDSQYQWVDAVVSYEFSRFYSCDTPQITIAVFGPRVYMADSETGYMVLVSTDGRVPVTGTTPHIDAINGFSYKCGECATLDVTLPASGCVDVTFESGSTPTVLTITPPTGVTVKWANGFDPTSLDANTTYEINIADGLGVAASWT